MKGTKQFLTMTVWAIGIIAAAIVLFFASDNDDQYNNDQPHQQHSQ